MPKQDRLTLNRPPAFDAAAERRHREERLAGALAHSLFGKAFSSLGRVLGPITQEASVSFEDHVLIEEGRGRIVLDQTGYPLAGWFSFQPLRDAIVMTDPDLFD